MRRPVVRSRRFLAEARELFPLGGDAAGRPSFELFESTLLPVCEQRFSTGFDELLEAIPGTSVRFLMTHALPIFPPLVVYGMLIVAGGEERIELVGVITDEDYFDTIEADPPD